MPVIPNNMSAREYLAEIGRRGGAAGKGRPKPKGQMRRAAEIRWAKDRERRDVALEVLGALVEAHRAIDALMKAPYRDFDFRDDAKLAVYDAMDDGYGARERAALAIERATGAKPGQATTGQSGHEDGPR